MDSVNTRIDNLMKDVQSVKSSLEFTQAQVEGLTTSDLWWPGIESLVISNILFMEM